MKSKINKTVLTAEEYVMFITEKSHTLNTKEDDEIQIEKILNDEGYDIWSYPLDEVDEAMENNDHIALVKLNHYRNGKVSYSEHRWYEVPILD
jgi:hypothetical protein